jgi:hypothetical protein
MQKVIMPVQVSHEEYATFKISQVVLCDVLARPYEFTHIGS